MVWWVAGADCVVMFVLFFFFSSRRRHTRFDCDWSSDVCSSDLQFAQRRARPVRPRPQPHQTAQPRRPGHGHHPRRRRGPQAGRRQRRRRDRRQRAGQQRARAGASLRGATQVRHNHDAPLTRARVALEGTVTQEAVTYKTRGTKEASQGVHQGHTGLGLGTLILVLFPEADLSRLGPLLRKLLLLFLLQSVSNTILTPHALASNSPRTPPPSSRPTYPYPADRKSTRLNSSHSQISYAVFCLKKKKNNTTRLYMFS